MGSPEPATASLRPLAAADNSRSSCCDATSNGRHNGRRGGRCAQNEIGTRAVRLTSGVSRVTPTPRATFKDTLSLKR